MSGAQRPRSLWVTVPLYCLGLALLALDGWATVFWTRVGDSLGVGLGLAGGTVIVVLGALLVLDARRQWLLFRVPDDDVPDDESDG